MRFAARESAMFGQFEPAFGLLRRGCRATSHAPHGSRPSARAPEAQSRIGAAMRRGLQTRDAELDLARLLGDAAEETSVAVIGPE